jgi:hypothetical protein
VAEVFNRIGIEQVRAILHASGLPKRLWGEALHHVVWLKNRASTAAVASKTPHEVVTGTKLDLSKLLEWGCTVWVHTKSNSKLDGHTEKGRWIGYDEQSKGSRIYWLEKGSVTVERSITFVPVVEVDDLEGEDKVSCKNSSSSDDLTPDELSNKPLEPSPPRTPPPKPVLILSAPRPQCIQKPTQYVRDI